MRIISRVFTPVFRTPIIIILPDLHAQTLGPSFSHPKSPPAVTLIFIPVGVKSRKKNFVFMCKCFKPHLRSRSFLFADSQNQEFASITASLISRTIKENVNNIFFSILLFPLLLPFSNKTTHIILMRPRTPILLRTHYFIPPRAQLYQRFLTQPTQYRNLYTVPITDLTTGTSNHLGPCFVRFSSEALSTNTLHRP